MSQQLAWQVATVERTERGEGELFLVEELADERQIGRAHV